MGTVFMGNSFLGDGIVDQGVLGDGELQDSYGFILQAQYTLPAPGLSTAGQKLALALRQREENRLRETCAVWSLWLIHMRLSRPDLSLVDAYNAAMASLTLRNLREGVSLGKALNRFIRRFLAQVYSLATYSLGRGGVLLVNGMRVPPTVTTALRQVGPLP